ncbi:MAG: YqiA/YcfP family alpha/beta fold hydrolase [Vicinamibacterales bacterium]
MTPHVFYLHGFASSPGSGKASYLAERFAAHHIRLRCPDFNQPDFATLTITRMLGQLEQEIAATGRGPVVLIGSSLGGTLAILSADRFGPRVTQLVLLAPAVMFARPGHHLFSPERVDEWRRRGVLPIFHYADKQERPLNFSFYEDSVRYNALTAKFAQPTLIVQGVRDASVDHRTVDAFARGRTNVTVSLVEDDHQLMASLPRIWSETETFLGLTD